MKTLRSRKYVILSILIMFVLSLSIVSGCGQNQKAGENRQTGSDGAITVAGSTSVQPFSEVLAENFMAKNPGVQINVQGGGSTQGVEAALNGVANIGSSSREIKSEEKARGLEVTQIAIDGIAVVVHPSNKVMNLSVEQLKNIYLGKIKNWKELGGDDAVITVVSREEGSGTKDAFDSIVMNKEKEKSTAIIQNSTGAVRTTVAGDKNAIGYISISKVNDEVKALDIDNVKASEANVKNGSYKLQRPFNYVTKGSPEGLAKAFIDFVLSDEGQRLIVEEGAFSVQ